MTRRRKRPFPRKPCPVCGKVVGMRLIGYQTGPNGRYHPVWHCAPGQEEPKHMGGKGCPGRHEYVYINDEDLFIDG